MKKILLIGLVFLLIITSVSANNNFYVNENASLYGTCLLANGSLGGDNMTIDIYYPDSTIFVDDALMTNYAVGQFVYNFSVPNILGEYPYSMTCTENGNSFSNSDSFEVFNYDIQDFIQINVDDESTQSVGFVFGLAFVVIFFFVLGFMSSTIGLKLGAFGISLIELLILVGSMYSTSIGVDFSGVLKINFWGLLIVGLIFGLYAFYEHSVGMIDPNPEDNNKKDKWGNKGWKNG